MLDDGGGFCCGTIVFILVVFVIMVIVSIADGDTAKKNEQEKVDKMAPEERLNYLSEKEFGPLNEAMVCPHCQAKGKIRTMQVVKKAGISGGKATAAVLTGGVSLVATGLSRKDGMTQAHCDECQNTWTF
ncbi:MAG TPA: hypothetical protein PKI15_04420 [Candidatus Cloacimonadota bacterium]|nr:hypothetical protein [Candidatus Cloacimonadota bacterium]